MKHFTSSTCKLLLASIILMSCQKKKLSLFAKFSDKKQLAESTAIFPERVPQSLMDSSTAAYDNDPMLRDENGKNVEGFYFSQDDFIKLTQLANMGGVYFRFGIKNFKDIHPGHDAVKVEKPR